MQFKERGIKSNISSLQMILLCDGKFSFPFCLSSHI